MPFYPDGVLDEIRNSVNIVSLISEFVALRKRGKNWVARCPFHTEKTPSFNVSEEKQIFMCFGCQVGGDIFKFIMQIEHLTFPESVRFIAERYGIPLPARPDPPEGDHGLPTDTLRKAMAAAAEEYHRLLTQAPEGAGALDYLEGRGVSAETMRRFQLGYSPDNGHFLLEHLQSRGFRLDALLECGLVKRSEDGMRHYDAFRGRIMFPITDIRGRVIAFGGRALGDHQPKYLNSPESRLYNKSRNLFGLSHSRQGIQRADCAILVEGYMDFIIPFQYGIENLVASLGTSLTAQQVKLLGRYTREVIVSYDPDSAGQAATQRSLELFLEEDFRVRVFPLPEGQDPDAFIRRVGAEKYRERLGKSVSYLDFVFENAVRSQGNLDNPKSKIQIINSVLPYLARVPHAVERSEYVFRFARRLRIEDQQLLAEVKRAAKNRKLELRRESLPQAGAMRLAEKRLLQLVVGNRELQRQFLPLCSAGDFEGLAAERIFGFLLDEFAAGREVDFDALHRRFAAEPEQAMLAQLQMEEVPEGHTEETAQRSLDALRTMRLELRKQQISTRIAEAERIRDDEMLNRLFRERVLVDRELVSLSRG